MSVLQKFSLHLHSGIRYAGFGMSACLTAWFMARGLWSFTQEPLIPSVPDTSTAPLSVVRAHPASTKAILQRNLMQLLPLPSRDPSTPTARADAQSAAPALSPDTLPLSTLGWQLLGTVASATPAESHAALLVDGKQQLVREGEQVNGWQVERVLRKTVILRKDAVRERLVLAVPQQAPSQPATTLETQPSKPANLKTVDPAALMREVALKPRSLGTRQGMEVTALLAESPLYAHGLRSGDVVLSVNGRPTRSYDDLPALLGALQEERIRVEVYRLGKDLILE